MALHKIENTFNRGHHSLRHTHATILIENGANVKDVQARLGHKHIETTLGTYTHPTEKMSDQSVDIFESLVHQRKNGGQHYYFFMKKTLKLLIFQG